MITIKSRHHYLLRLYIVFRKTRSVLHRSDFRFTKGYLPLALVYWEAHESRASAVRRERTLKSWKSKKRLAALIEGFDGGGQ